MPIAVPPNEVDRLHALVAYRILDTPHEGEFDQCARLVAQLCGTEIGAVTLIDRDRQWMKAVHGPMPRIIPRHHAFCAQTILQSDPLEVPDARLDARFAQNPSVTGEPYVRFYAGVALQARNGLALGTVCVMDPRPQRLNGRQLKALEIAASYVSAQLELRLGVLQMLEERTIAAAQSDAIQRASQRQTELSALLVHDLRSPLSAVALNGAFLRDEDNLSADQQQAIDDILSACRKLSGMVTDLLHVGRAEDGGLMVQRPVEVDVGAVVVEAVTRVRAMAEAARVTLETLGCSPGTCVAGDAELLGRILTNLLDNACKYTPEGSSVRVELSVVGSSAVLRVIDAGAGIPPAQRLLVFDKYFQVEQGAAVVRPGYGLGLSFCKLAVEAHGGTIEVEEVPMGCSFRVALPLFGTRTAVVSPSRAMGATRDDSVQRDADAVVVLARKVADGVLELARSHEDEKLLDARAPPTAIDAVHHEREEADRVLDEARTEADRKVQKEREPK